MGSAAFGSDTLPQDGNRFVRRLRQLAGANEGADGELLGVFGRHAHFYRGFLHGLYKKEDIGRA